MTGKIQRKGEFKKINFEKWITDRVDPVIKHVESLIGDNAQDDTQKAVKLYWHAFAQNTINLSRIIFILPQNFSQVMMAFRLLQESSADIFYLKNNKENITSLIKVSEEIRDLTASDNFTVRNISQSITKTDIRSSDNIKSRKDATQDRIEQASKYLEKKLGEGLTNDLTDINNLLNGYSHFNPASIYIQNNLTDHGYIEMYMKILTFYPAWLYLVLISIHDLMGVQELDAEKSKKIVEELLEKIEESHDWQVIKFSPDTQQYSKKK